MIIVVLGGARSGKSEVAEARAGELAEPVIFVATAMCADSEMARRIAVHEARRPPSWRTLEVSPGCDLAQVLAELAGTAVVDSLGTWLAGVESFEADTNRLCESLCRRRGDTVVVSDEVGLGVHPSSEAGRLFRDALGAVNRAVVEIADEALLVVAGRTLQLGSG